MNHGSQGSQSLRVQGGQYGVSGGHSAGDSGRSVGQDGGMGVAGGTGGHGGHGGNSVVGGEDSVDQKKKRRRRTGNDSLALLASSSSSGIIGSYLVDKNNKNGSHSSSGGTDSVKRSRALQAIRSSVHFALSLSGCVEKEIEIGLPEPELVRDKRHHCLVAVRKALSLYYHNTPLSRVDTNIEDEYTEHLTVTNKSKSGKGRKKEKEYSISTDPILSSVSGVLLTPTVVNGNILNASNNSNGIMGGSMNLGNMGSNMGNNRGRVQAPNMTLPHFRQPSSHPIPKNIPGSNFGNNFGSENILGNSSVAHFNPMNMAANITFPDHFSAHDGNQTYHLAKPIIANLSTSMESMVQVPRVRDREMEVANEVVWSGERDTERDRERESRGCRAEDNDGQLALEGLLSLSKH